MVSERKLHNLALGFMIVYAGFSAYSTLVPFLGFMPPRFFMPLLTLLGFAFALVHARTTMGFARMLLLLVLTFVVSLLYESIGVATGWIYGPYHYTAKLGPRFLGLVPFLIPVAWFMMIYPAQVIAEALLGDRFPTGWRKMISLALVSALIMTAWDVLMDPIMVRMGFWIWEVEGDYFGIPLQNYLGWLLTTSSVYLLYQVISSRLRSIPVQPVKSKYMSLAAWAYLVTWASNTLAALHMDLGGAALAGAFSVGVIAILGVLVTTGGSTDQDAHPSLA